MRVEKVYIKPLIAESTYDSSWTDVSDSIGMDALSNIKRSIDSTDYTIGVYTFNDVTLKGDNSRGLFNEFDSRSIFPYIRDKAKVKIEVNEIDVEAETITATTQFEGLINDEATRQNITNDEITIKVLSTDSVLRTTGISVGALNNTMTVSQALLAILDVTVITNVLTVSAGNLVPDYDYVVDQATLLEELTVKEALDKLLVSSGSCLTIVSNTIYVSSRNNATGGTPILYLYGGGSIPNDPNILSISKYNPGKQRQFNRILINDVLVAEDSDYIDEYGVRAKNFDFNMVTASATVTAIGTAILAEFKEPKIELTLRVKTADSQDYDLLDLSSVDAPWLKRPADGYQFMPVCGAVVLGDDEAPLPIVTGSVQIDPNIKFKIISIEDDPKLFISTLKLRQYGTLTNDGYFT